jgi:transglutaminase-like putative cysteine protease
LTDTRGFLLPAAALLGLAAPAVIAWSSLIGGFGIAVMPVAALAASALAGRQRGGWAAGPLAIWILAAPLLAGVPADQLEPAAWTVLPSHVANGMRQLAVARAPDASDPWVLADALLLAGAMWIAAAALARRQPGAAFAAGAAPWLAAALLHPAHAAVWQGAAVVLAGLAWHAWPRTSARAAVVLSVAVALASALTAPLVAPRHRWFGLPGSHATQPGFQLLEIEPTFERLADRRIGAPMLEIAASEPAFWRLQALDVFDGGRWRVGSDPPQLPEPAARPARIDVRVRGLRNSLVASPGAVDHVDSAGTAQAVAGAAWRLVPGPRAGDEYGVDARVVRGDPAALQRARAPRGPRVAAYTRLGWDSRSSRHGGVVLQIGSWKIKLPTPGSGEPRGFPIDIPPFGEPRDAGATAALGRSPYRDVAALARRLASGARNEWQVVARVMRYLRDPDRFRYTTDVPPPGPFPLADFLLRTHAGYCQHFAGAAALLLRLAGVPARVVAGFATGVRSRGRFVVRDVDAHDWIEVYFAGYGWVPFNPTPASAPAAIAPELDLLATTGGRERTVGTRALVTLGVFATIMLAGWRRRRRPRLDDALGRLLPTPISPSTTLAELRDELARRFGPHTSALAAQAERARFGPHGAAPRRWTHARIAGALARDLGPWRAMLVLTRPTTGAASAGARSSQQVGHRGIG